MNSSRFLGSFLSKGLKTNQLEVNTDEKTLRPIARLKEPRDLFALPKDKEHDCPQQAPRWPIECQVIEERIVHIPYAPAQPEPYNIPSGNELRPRPVGEENGLVVFNYNPISAVNYEQPENAKRLAGGGDSSDSDISSDDESRGSSPERQKDQDTKSFSKLLHTLDQRSSSISNDECDEIAEMQQNAALQKELWNEQMELAKIARLNAVSPVRINDALMARLNLSINPNSNYSSSSISSDISDINLTVNGTIDTDRTNKTLTACLEDKSCSGCSTQQATDETKISNANNNKKNLLEILNLNLNPQLLGTNDSKLTITNGDAQTGKFFKTYNDDSSSQTDPLLPQFSRSAVGGSKFLTNCHPYNPDEYDGLEFESRFESGNLAKAVQITPTYYELYLRPDLYTSRSKQWFYFRVKQTKKDLMYRFSIVNLVKSDSLYNEGMRPLMYSTINAKQVREGWRRCGTNICYYRNDDESSTDEDDDNSTYTLTFNIEFQHDNDTVYFAHSYPYTYSELQDYLMDIQKHPVKSKFCKLRLLCRSLAGNNVYYLTVTAPTNDEEAMRRKKSIVVSARVHPSETPASWMMKGLMDFITGDTLVAKRLRHKFIFKLIPMLNPDGVIVGNTRNSLTGKDLNRQYRTVIRETYPSIWYTKAMIKRLIDECGVAMYCDMHAHSRKHNIFIYGCENKRNPEKKLTEQVFPLMMHKNVADKFSFEGCKFKIQRSKEGTGRIVVWMLGITNSYTIEASFGGSSLGSRKGTHFTTADYEHMGRAFCETLLDYCDENPNKVKKHVKIFKQIKKIRKREKAERKALKLKKLADQERLRLKIIGRLLKEGSSADEPLNIPLSDYSSDEGESSSSSDNEGKGSISLSDLEGPCCAPLKAPPCSPATNAEMRKFKFTRMRKIMHELDRIYFQPMFHKKFRVLMGRKQKQKKQQKSKSARSTAGNDDSDNKDDSTNSEQSKESSEQVNQRSERMQEVQKVIVPSAKLNKLEKIDKSTEDSLSEQTTATIDTTTTTNTTTSTASKKIIIKKKKRVPLYENPMRPNGRIRVSRILRLWLEKRNIIIYRQKKVRKVKLRTKSKRQQNRQALDMPTTDPGSDILFSTDDELYPEPTSPGMDIYGVMPRHRRILLQSELQRRYIEEIGDGIQRRMPPELIITSPTKTTTIRVDPQLYSRMTSTAPAKEHLNEFPLITMPTRRTYSWHSLSSTGKPTQKTKSPMTAHSNPYNNSEDLQFRLSLKKKIWTGVQPEYYPGSEYNRPLSWSMPPVGNQTRKEKNTTSARSTCKRDQKEAFVSACSQKLIAWQQSNSTTSLLGRKKLTVNLVATDTEEEKSFRTGKQMSSKKKQRTVTTKIENNDPKSRKDKVSLSRITETTQIVTRLTKTTKSRNAYNAYQQQYNLITPTNSLHMISQQKSPMQKTKFKTSGIVATAVQPIAKKGKKIRILNTNSTKILQQEFMTETMNNSNVKLSQKKLELPPSAVTIDSSTFMGKVKSKLKKKKSKRHTATSERGELGAAAEYLNQTLYEVGTPARMSTSKRSNNRLIGDY